MSQDDRERMAIAKKLGWQCPACNRGNAPWVPECNCWREDKPKPPEQTAEQAYADAFWKKVIEQSKQSPAQQKLGDKQHDFDPKMIGGKCRVCGWSSVLPYRPCS